MNPKYIFFLLIFVLFIDVQAKTIIEQKDVQKTKTAYGFEVNREKPINFNIFVNYVSANWTPQILVALKISNNVLQFKKEIDGYSAHFQATIAIKNKEKSFWEKTQSRIVKINRFEDTNSREKFQRQLFVINIDTSSLSIKEGELQCFLDLRDMTTQKNYRSYRKFRLFKENQKNNISEIAFTSGSAHKNKIPKLLASYKTFSIREDITAYLKLQNKPLEKVEVEILEKNDNEPKLLHQEYWQPDSSKNSWRLHYPIPIKTLKEGPYLLRFTGKTAAGKFKKESDFTLLWFKKPTYLYKSDLAIRPMKYILSEDEFKQARSLDYDELSKWLDAYWKAKDPTPNSEYNELRYEFFKRVSAANKKFSNRSTEGWETDRGKILILFGEPLKIYNKRYNKLSKMIWEYPNHKIFTFLDESKTGEFKLMPEED
jgi:GWxTD domain-containing protein